MLLLVRCDKCGNNQKVAPRVKSRSDVSKKSKRCVYCGKSFKIHSGLDNSRILKELPSF